MHTNVTFSQCSTYVMSRLYSAVRDVLLENSKYLQFICIAQRVFKDLENTSKKQYHSKVNLE